MNQQHYDKEIIMLDGNLPRYIVEPFERIFKDDPRYETALTREQINEMIKNNLI